MQLNKTKGLETSEVTLNFVTLGNFLHLHGMGTFQTYPVAFSIELCNTSYLSQYLTDTQLPTVITHITPSLPRHYGTFWFTKKKKKTKKPKKRVHLSILTADAPIGPFLSVPTPTVLISSFPALGVQMS